MELAEKLELIGKRIRLIRVSKGLRQSEVAKQLGISQAHLSNIEYGRNSITLDTLFKLQELFSCLWRKFYCLW